ncbi:MAG: AmmeMemoRadiSam system protein A [Deltaproteobacteria bacterium]|nr:AmmeMemoRadiSam system protein A [Deltaproteobacteria bacterium]
MLSEKEKDEFLQVARKTLEGYLSEGEMPDLRPAGGALTEPGGAFVTLHHRDGRLRGCIGRFEAPDPLYKTVQLMAVAAATEDPRFPPVQSAELSNLHIEISALSPRRPIEDVGEIIVGKHGLSVEKEFNRGCLLPQVATEENWTREEFLSHTCLKAGLPPDSWKKGGMKIEVFEAEVFGEPR